MDLHHGVWSESEDSFIARYKPGIKQILDEQTILEVGEDLQKGANYLDSRVIAIDCSGVDHLSAAALGMFIITRNNYRVQNKKTVLLGLNEPILKVFQITRLSKVFPIYATSQGLRDAFDVGGIKPYD